MRLRKHIAAKARHWALIALPTLAWQSNLALAESDPVLEAERARIEMIARVSPAVVCVNDTAQRGGGSGVLIHEDGYGLTNYHVVAGMLNTRKGLGGLPDGKQYELEVLGIDPTGDVAMFRLTGADKFPYASLGDSDLVRVGDVVYAIGNPFSLSEDNTPSVSMGIVSGTNRYQHGVGGNLAYTDCLQVDAAINPGNSGGPLFNQAGEIIGINGRISVSTRGRFNVGHGYAISANQIRRFVPALRAGLLGRHGTLAMTPDEVSPGMVLFGKIIGEGAADRAGIRAGDRLISIDGTFIVSRNQFASILGTYPADWPLRLEIESDGLKKDLEVRLDPIQPRLPMPFVVSQEMNRREVRRVLRDFRRAVLRDAAAKPPNRRQWRATRTIGKIGDPSKSVEVFDVRSEREGPIEMTRLNDDGRPGMLVHFDDRSAWSRVTKDGETMELPTEDRLALSAMFVLERRMLAELPDDQLGEVAHAGGDARLDMSGANAEVTAEAKNALAAMNRVRPALEVLSWPIGDQSVARFLFDPQTGRAVRIVARDVPTGLEATIDVQDYEWIGGIVWPQTLLVRSRDQSYKETRSDWRLDP